MNSKYLGEQLLRSREKGKCQQKAEVIVEQLLQQKIQPSELLKLRYCKRMNPVTLYRHKVQSQACGAHSTWIAMGNEISRENLLSFMPFPLP